MKSFVILCVVVLAMANAQERVNVVDPGYYQGGNTNGVHVVDYPSNSNGVNVVSNPDPYFYQNPGGNGAGVNVVNNPDPYFYQNPGGNGAGVNVVNIPDPFFYQNPGGNGVGVINNPDPGFYQPPNPYYQYPDGNNGVVVIPNPDPGFSVGGPGGAQRPDIRPAYVNTDRYPIHLYPGGQYGNNFSGARGGSGK